ncbi:MAG: dTDP-4-dehydrorhamnose 3,5-epimerase [Cohaesibacter sp.]|nr:dTDP-4-dehydrorhamnose 3,5-epimerase [Cohaesibacter sp.]
MSLTVKALEIAGAYLISPPKFGDHRGFFSETYNKQALAEQGFEHEFVQDNQSVSTQKGVIRGLHFQTNPKAQGKLIRVTHGAILDILVDIRKGSPTYGQHLTIELSAQNWQQVYVPVGIAHGFCTLSEITEVHYKVTNFYAPDCDKGLAFDDPALGIDWPVALDQAILSDKDRQHPKLADLPDYFTFGDD